MAMRRNWFHSHVLAVQVVARNAAEVHCELGHKQSLAHFTPNGVISCDIPFGNQMWQWKMQYDKTVYRYLMICIEHVQLPCPSTGAN